MEEAREGEEGGVGLLMDEVEENNRIEESFGQMGWDPDQVQEFYILIFFTVIPL